MRRVNPLYWALVLPILLVVLPGTAGANDRLAKVENLGDALVFHPIVEFNQLILTVTGPCGFDYRQVVREGEPFFRLDETTINGVYRFNLFREERVDPGIVEILQQARAKFDEETPKELCRAGRLPGPPQVQAGGFLVSRGQIIFDPDAVEKTRRSGVLEGDLGSTPAAAVSGSPVESESGLLTNLTAADFVIIDDLIVDGSACIGFDCINGETFGFDTLKLKENNLRIKFDDTSTASSYPRNDWQLTANDSANGGASKFSIDDISGNRTPFTVEANARSHSLYVDDGGRIGSRTSTPSVELHTIDGDTPTLRLQQDGSSGFAPQTWDVAGNETNFFIRDVTNGSQLPFRIRPDAPTSSIFIDTDGDVGMGTSSPDAPLEIVRNTGGQLVMLQMENNGAVQTEWENTAVGVTWRVGQNNAGDFVINDTADLGTAEFQVTTAGVVSVNGGQVHPDYVFDPSYELMPLAELAAFVAEKRHLPNVQSKTEREENGGRIILNELPLQILEKVEELVLYTLKQQDQITAQQDQISAQQQQISALQEALNALPDGGIQR